MGEYEPIVRQANEVALKALNADQKMTVDQVINKVVEQIKEIEPKVTTE